MNDSWIKDRAKALSREMSPYERRGTEPDAEPAPFPARAARAERPEQTDLQTAGDVPRALQVLALAQRQAEEHVADAHGQADRIQAEARATAEQIIREAQAEADAVRREADKALSDARAAEGQTAREAQAHADNARRQGDKIVADARGRAAEAAKDAQGHADRLAAEGRQRYADMVGNLEARREALQQQIEALQEFDRNYRGRLSTYVQAQLRALWVDEPHADAEIEHEIEQPGRSGRLPGSAESRGGS